MDCNFLLGRVDAVVVGTDDEAVGAYRQVGEIDFAASGFCLVPLAAPLAGEAELIVYVLSIAEVHRREAQAESVVQVRQADVGALFQRLRQNVITVGQTGRVNGFIAQSHARQGDAPLKVVNDHLVRVKIGNAVLMA